MASFFSFGLPIVILKAKTKKPAGAGFFSSVQYCLNRHSGLLFVVLVAVAETAACRTRRLPFLVQV